MDKQAIGTRIRRLRYEAGLTQAELAERIDRHPGYLSNIERGSLLGAPGTLHVIAHELGVSVADLLGPEDGPADPVRAAS